MTVISKFPSNFRQEREQAKISDNSFNYRGKKMRRLQFKGYLPIPALLPGQGTEKRKKLSANYKNKLKFVLLIISGPTLLPTWVCPGLTEVDFDTILPHWCRHYCIDIPTCFLLDITVCAAGSSNAGVVSSCPVQLYCVIVDLRAQRAPVHPERVVGPAIELDAGWTAGTYKRVSGFWVVAKCGGVPDAFKWFKKVCESKFYQFHCPTMQHTPHCTLSSSHNACLHFCACAYICFSF